MGEDTVNEGGLLKDTYTKKKGGFSELVNHLRDKAHEAIDDLHDRVAYTTKVRKDALEEASGEPMPKSGFLKAKESK